VRSPEGTVHLDPTGRMAGRGAYLCQEASCWDLAGRKRALEHALKVPVPADILAALVAGSATTAGDITRSSDTEHNSGVEVDAPTPTHEGGPHGSK
jgi:uncharacterized protein